MPTPWLAVGFDVLAAIWFVLMLGKNAGDVTTLRGKAAVTATVLMAVLTAAFVAWWAINHVRII